MSSPLTPQRIRNIGIYGVIRPSEVDDMLIPDGAVTESINFHFDRKGAATVRPGMSAIGSTVLANMPCVGLFNAQAGTALAVFSNGGSSTIYSLSGTTWSVSLDGGTASVKIRFVDFGSYTIAVNFAYNTLSSMRFWNAGSSRHWHNTGNPINPQNMWGYNPQLGEVFKSRVYLAGDPGYKGRLWFSSVISSTGNITFTPNTDYVDINPGDGEDATALKRYSTELLYMKPNYIYRFRTTGVDPDPMIKVGTRSNESLVEGKRGLYFHHDSGFYRYSGGYPVEISRPISDYVDAIPFSQFKEITGWNDKDHIFWSVGTITVQEAMESVTIKNAIFRYTESADLWTVYSYANDVRRAMIYTDGTTLRRIAGLDNGIVAQIDSGTTDVGEPIKYRMRTKWYEWEGIETTKTIREIMFICERAQGIEVKYQIDEEREWRTIGQVKRLMDYFDHVKIKFNRIRFQVHGVSRSEPPIFRGIEVKEGINEGMIKQKIN